MTIFFKKLEKQLDDEFIDEQSYNLKLFLEQNPNEKNKVKTALFNFKEKEPYLANGIYKNLFTVEILSNVGGK